MLGLGRDLLEQTFDRHQNNAVLARLFKQDLCFLFVANHEGSLFSLNMLKDSLLLSNLIRVAERLVTGVFLVLLHIGNNVVHLPTA